MFQFSWPIPYHTGSNQSFVLEKIKEESRLQFPFQMTGFHTHLHSGTVLSLRSFLARPWPFTIASIHYAGWSWWFLLCGPRGRALCYSMAISAFIFQLWQTGSGLSLDSLLHHPLKRAFMNVGLFHHQLIEIVCLQCHLYMVHFLPTTLYLAMHHITMYIFLYISHGKTADMLRKHSNKIVPLYSLRCRSYFPRSLPELHDSCFLHSDGPSSGTQWTQSRTHILFYPLKYQVLFCKIPLWTACSLIPRIPTQ